jgi:hypothetical protein
VRYRCASRPRRLTRFGQVYFARRRSRAFANIASGNAKVRDPFQLRVNAYRVLLTRGRDCAIVYVPKLGSLDETYDYLIAAGFVVVSERRKAQRSVTLVT